MGLLSVIFLEWYVCVLLCTFTKNETRHDSVRRNGGLGVMLFRAGCN
jgi:hypothetical protein